MVELGRKLPLNLASAARRRFTPMTRVDTASIVRIAEARSAVLGALDDQQRLVIAGKPMKRPSDQMMSELSQGAADFAARITGKG